MLILLILIALLQPAVMLAQAAPLAVATVRAHVEATAIREVTFCCFSANDLEVYERALG